ncbi:MAG: otsA1 [Nitrospira sp.]|nr:otsA1 [Nitrospira sp.]
MRLSLRFILPLLLVLGVVAYSVVPLVDSLTLKWFTRDLESRSKLLASTMEVPLSDLVASRSRTKIFAYFHKVIQDERLYALGFCDAQQRLLYQTLTYPDRLSCESLAHLAPGSSEVVNFAQGPLHVVVATIQSGGKVHGRLMLVHDMSFVHQRSTDTKWYRPNCIRWRKISMRWCASWKLTAGCVMKAKSPGARPASRQSCMSISQAMKC